MDDDQIENGLDELAAQTVKRFCPQCGEAIVENLRGRPKVFCSDRCRYAWKNTHPKPENWASTRTAVCPVCGKSFLAFREYDRPRKYCSRACANRARAKEWRNQNEQENGKENHRCLPDQ